MPSAFYIMIKMGWTARRKALNGICLLRAG